MVTKQEVPSAIEDTVRRLENLQYVANVWYRKTEEKTEFLPSGEKRVREKFDLFIISKDKGGVGSKKTDEITRALMPHIIAGEYNHFGIIYEGYLLENPDFKGMTLAYSRK